MKTPNRNLLRKFGFALAGVGVLALASGTALAGGGKRGGQYFTKVSAKLEQALEAIQATPEQRTALEQAKQQAFAAIKPIRKEMRAKRVELRQLRDAQQPDQTRLQQLQTEQTQLKQQIKGVAIQFMKTAKLTLSEPQLKALKGFVQQNGPLFQVHKRQQKA